MMMGKLLSYGKVKGLKRHVGPESMGYTIPATAECDWYVRSVLSQPGTAPERGLSSQKLHRAASSVSKPQAQFRTHNLKPGTSKQPRLGHLPGHSGQC